MLCHDVTKCAWCFWTLFTFGALFTIKNKSPMAKFDGIFEIQGTLKGMTFYKSEGSSFIRTKGGVSKERFKNDPAFERTRENGQEFKHVAQVGQLLRKSTGNFYKLAKDSKVASRLVKVLSEVKKLDTTSVRGQRVVQNGLVDEVGKNILKGFDFNLNSRFKVVFRNNYQFDTTTGTFSTETFVPQEDLYFPEGATHVKMGIAASRVDLETGSYQTSFSPVLETALNGANQPISLTPSNVPEGNGLLFYFLLIEFKQEMNGILYPLKNNAYNVLHLLEVQ